MDNITPDKEKPAWILHPYRFKDENNEIHAGGCGQPPLVQVD
jgi:hypothetical protein